jgi:hypothetical protein
VLDRYRHLLPGSEDKVTDALDALARRAAVPPAPPSVRSIPSATASDVVREALRRYLELS